MATAGTRRRGADALQVDLDTVYLDDGHLAVRGPRKPPRAVADVCACTDDQCVIDWIGGSLGCGVCAHVACDGEERGGCLPCQSIDEPATTSCVFSDVAVSALD